MRKIVSALLTAAVVASLFASATFAAPGSGSSTKNDNGSGKNGSYNGCGNHNGWTIGC